MLRDTNRRVTTLWHDHPLFCRCRVSATIATGAGTMTAVSATLWVVPIPYIVIGLGLLVPLGVLGWFL
ncbi:MAG TPA: hypothetical protein VE152_00940 [Acidimicrobiales bacterium]|nr:hypothetical protein [Acidimicrobiales bacterium]